MDESLVDQDEDAVFAYPSEVFVRDDADFKTICLQLWDAQGMVVPSSVVNCLKNGKRARSQ